MSRVSLYSDDTHAWGVIQADALLTLAKLPDSCVDAVVCDPPYGIAFCGESWDGADIRRAVNGSGEGLSPAEAFQRWTRVWAQQCGRVLKPGGHLVAFGAPRTFHRLVCGVEESGLEVRDTLLWLYSKGFPKSRHLPGGRATTLKPAYEPVLLARKPLDGAAEENIARWGTGALNIDATRVGPQRYWPANVALTHSPDCPVEIIDAEPAGPSRLFYCAKASRAEREAGCEQFPRRSVALYSGKRHSPRLVGNLHPTVKPLSLMRWLVRLVTPPGGLVLDPFAGSGSTGIAAVLEGRPFVGIERESDYVDIACARLTHWGHNHEIET